MLSQVTAIRFDRVSGSGRTRPCFMLCADDQGREHEVVVKLMSDFDLGSRALANEAIASCLGSDLALPVPEHFAVKIEQAFAESIIDLTVKTRLLSSLGWNYGSRRLPESFSAMAVGERIPRELFTIASEIFAFDAIIENPDRKVSNPNLLWNHNEIWLFDHEQSFLFDKILFWRPIWVSGVVPRGRTHSDRHALIDFLRGRDLDLDRFEASLRALPSERVAEYVTALPASWRTAELDRIPAYLVELKDNLRRAIRVVKGAVL